MNIGIESVNMKNLLLLISLFGLCQVAAAQKKLLVQSYHSQKQRGTIADFLQELNQYSGTVLEYSSGSFDANKLVQLNGDETTVGQLLQKVLEGQRVKLLEYNNKIILVPSPEPFNLQEFLPVRYALFGYIKEAGSKEPLTDATVYEPASQSGTVSNNYGYYNLLLSEGKHTIQFSYTGLQTVTLEVNVRRNAQKDISLQMSKQSIEKAIVIQSEEAPADGSTKITTGKKLPNVLAGESDPVRAGYLIPGVQNMVSSFAGYQVRGGGIDENLFLLDGNPVYNPTHLLGALSIINPTVMKTLRFYKSDFPARLSGSLSSVMDVYTKDGNMESWHGEASAGLLAGSLTLEGPLSKNKTAIMLSARKNISLPFYNSFKDGITANFYDTHFKMTCILNDRNKLNLNLYKGEDQFWQTGKDINNLHKWGNTLGSVGWNYLLGGRSFINTSLNLSCYENLGGFQYTLYKDDDETQIIQTKSVGTLSSIQQVNLKSQAEIFASKKIKFNTGVKASQISIKPFDTKVSDVLQQDQSSFTSFDPLNSQELSGYIESEIKIGTKLFARPGLHVTVYQFKDYRTIALQPRFYIAYRFLPGLAVYGSYSRMNQFLHLVTNPFLSFNKDLWVPSTQQLQPEWSDIYNIGYSLNQHKGFRTSVDVYYKSLNNVTNYAEGKTMFIGNTNWEQSIETGKGRSYGAEWMAEKKGEKFSLQCAYALSWSWRQFKSINQGKEFPYKYDRRHTANAGCTYAITQHIDASALWTFATGDAYTLPNQIYPDFDNAQQVSTTGDPLDNYRLTYYSSNVNQYRTKPYQRYDASCAWHSEKRKKICSELTMGIYNINGSDDQYTYTLRGSMTSRSLVVKSGNSVFKMMPYVSYSLKF